MDTGLIRNLLDGLEGLITGPLPVRGITIIGVSLLANFDYSEPATIGVDGSGSFVSAYGTDQWEDFSTGTVPNETGTETLVNTGGLTNRNTANLWNGTNFTTRKGWEATATSQRLEASGTSAGVPGSGDFGGRLNFRFPGDPAAIDYMFSNRGGASNRGWYLYSQGGSGSITIGVTDNSGSSRSATLTGAHNDGAWHCVSFWYDASTGTLYIKSNLTSEASATGATLGSIDPTPGINVNGWNDVGSTGTPGIQVAYVGVSVGANAQNFYDENIVLPGVDPATQDAAKTELTTQARGSLISVPMSATTVGHFSDDQLPIGFDANFSDTNKLGAYCNSAVVNLIIKSEDIFGWTAQNSTIANNAGDAPDGFRSASTITSTAAAGAARSPGETVVASTEYTLSAWVARNGGSDITGGLKVYDITNAAFITTRQDFTAGAAYGLESRTFTTPVGCVSVYCYIECDVATSSIFAWGAQLNLGDARGAYIRTSGGSASLVACTYQASGNAGEFCKNSVGESETTWVAAFDTDPGSTLPSLWGSGNASTNIDRVMLRGAGSGRQPQFLLFDSAASSQMTLSKAAASDMSTQENTVVTKWDETGGLALGGGEDGTYQYLSESVVTDVGTYTGSDLAPNINIGSNRQGTNQGNNFISRVRIWDGERA